MNDAERESLVTIFEEPKNQEISSNLQQAEKDRESPEITCVEEVNLVDDIEGGGEGEEVQIGCQKCPQLFLTEADLILHTDFQHGEINDTLNNLQDFNVLLEEEEKEADKENPEKAKVSKSKKSIEEICKELETSQRPLIKFKWPKVKVKTKPDSDDDEMDNLLQPKEASSKSYQVPIKSKKVPTSTAGPKQPKNKVQTLSEKGQEVSNAGNHGKGNQKKAEEDKIGKDQVEGSEASETISSSKKLSLTKKSAPKCFKRKDWSQEGKWRSGFLHLCDSTFYQSWPEAKLWLEQNQDHLLSGTESQVLTGENAAKTVQTPKKVKLKAENKTPVKSGPKTPKKSEAKTPIKSVAKKSATPRKLESKTPTKSALKTPTKYSSKTPLKSASKSTAKSQSQTPKKSHPKTPIKSESKTPTKAKAKTPIKSELRTPRKSELKSALKTPTKSSSKTFEKEISKTGLKSNPKKASKANSAAASKSQKKPKEGKTPKIAIKYKKPKSVIKDHSKVSVINDISMDENDTTKKRKLANLESPAKRRKISEVSDGFKGDAEGSLQVKWDCSQCGANFAVKRNLAVHMQKKHGVYDHFDQTNKSKVLKTPQKKKSWDCDPCEFQFELKRDLATHNESQHRAKRAPGLRQCK